MGRLVSLRRGLAPSVALVAALLAAPSTAEACSPVIPPALTLHVDDGERLGVPTDGVIAFPVRAYFDVEDALTLLSVEVTQDGTAVAGTIETIALGTTVGLGMRTDLIVVWRPAAALASSTSYVARITVDEPSSRPVVLDITTGVGASGPLPTITLADVELVAERSGTSPRVCCFDGDFCGDACASPELADRPVLRASLVVEADPMAAQAYVRMSSGVDDVLAEDSIGPIATEISGTVQRRFDVAGNYCFGAELVSLIDGSVQPMVSRCEAHGDLELGGQANPEFEGFLAQCEGEPYWEDTGEPYEPSGGTGDSGGGDSGGGEAGGGESTGESSDGRTGSDESSGDLDGGGGQDVSARGCACSVQDRGVGGLVWGMLAIAGAWTRRRH